MMMTAALALLSIRGMAQTQTVTAGGTTFGIRAGVNLQNLNGKEADGDKLENKLVPRFNVGVNAEIPVATDFYLQPGLLFATKGTKSEGGLSGDDKLTLSYIELPVNFIYKPTLGAGKLLLGFGPYVAYGIGGKVKSDVGGDIDVKFKGDVEAGDDPAKAYFKPFDAGANLLFGYELSNRLSAQLNAQLGLVNILPDYAGAQDSDARAANTGFGISLGYRF